MIRNLYSDLFINLKNKYSNLTPRELALLCIKITDKISKTYGNHIAGNCQFNLFSYFIFYLAIQHILCSIYTAYYYWNLNKISSLQPFTLFALVVPVC